MYLDICLMVLMVAAVFTDLKSRRIPNILIGAGLVFAFSYHFYTRGVLGLIFGLKGFGVGIAILLVPFILGGLGAGDVKLLGVVGACKGMAFAISTFLWMALWGGALAVVLLVVKGQLLATLRRLGRGLLVTGLGFKTLGYYASKDEMGIYYPYALAIGLGVLTSYFKGW